MVGGESDAAGELERGEHVRVLITSRYTRSARRFLSCCNFVSSSLRRLFTKVCKSGRGLVGRWNGGPCHRLLARNISPTYQQTRSSRTLVRISGEFG